jgi:hypothetical protein
MDDPHVCGSAAALPLKRLSPGRPKTVAYPLGGWSRSDRGPWEYGAQAPLGAALREA